MTNIKSVNESEITLTENKVTLHMINGNKNLKNLQLKSNTPELIKYQILSLIITSIT